MMITEQKFDISKSKLLIEDGKNMGQSITFWSLKLLFWVIQVSKAIWSFSKELAMSHTILLANLIGLTDGKWDDRISKMAFCFFFLNEQKPGIQPGCEISNWRKYCPLVKEVTSNGQ